MANPLIPAEFPVARKADVIAVLRHCEFCTERKAANYRPTAERVAQQRQILHVHVSLADHDRMRQR